MVAVLFQDTLQHLVLSKLHAVLALNILVLILLGYQYHISWFFLIFSFLIQVWQLNNKVLRNIAWYSLIHVFHTALNISQTFFVLCDIKLLLFALLLIMSTRYLNSDTCSIGLSWMVIVVIFVFLSLFLACYTWFHWAAICFYFENELCFHVILKYHFQFDWCSQGHLQTRVDQFLYLQ